MGNGRAEPPARSAIDEDRGCSQPLALIRPVAELGLEVESSPYLHRWRYAQVVQPYHSPYWLSPQLKLAACGDWGVGPGVESAVISASKLVAAIAARSLVNDSEADHY